ncbi:hypothetical protein [Selenomonas sp. AE3005]|uniref:hypothetical protein n=1 Tax=Selenomonas sp. AE3005 TaxID=1485543 RepID=UPI0004868586|nr:hypothetical protein [Selenomonas sp. AE3005]
MLFSSFRIEVKKFFGTIMLVLKERGISREERKNLIRNSGLIEKCREYGGAQYVMHYDVYDWCNYLMNGYRWPTNEELHKFAKYDPRLQNMIKNGSL